MIEPWVIQAIVSIIGGGLAGGILTLWYNNRIAKQRKVEKEKGTIDALIGELRLARSICEVNRFVTTTVFIHFPTMVATRVAFTERDFYPLLKKHQTDLEQYVLTASIVNESIDMYFRVLPMRKEYISLDEFRKPITDTCWGGENKIQRIDSFERFTLPELINDLELKLRQLSTKP